MDTRKTEILEIRHELVCNIISQLSEEDTLLEVIPIYCIKENDRNDEDYAKLSVLRLLYMN